MFQSDILYKDIFSRCPLIWGSISKTTFSRIFWVLPIDYSLYERIILRIFFLFVYLLLFVYFFINSALKPQHLLFVYKQRTQASTPLIANEPFLHKMLVLFFSSNILLFNEKNPVEKLCKQGYY